jgi:hypothetical protein
VYGVLTTEADGMDGQLEIFIDTGPTHNYDAAELNE